MRELTGHFLKKPLYFDEFQVKGTVLIIDNYQSEPVIHDLFSKAKCCCRKDVALLVVK